MGNNWSYDNSFFRIFSFLFFSSYLLNLKIIRPSNTFLTFNGLPLERSELVVLRTLPNLIFNFDGRKTIL